MSNFTNFICFTAPYLLNDYKLYGVFDKVSICDVNSSTGDTLAQELGQKFNKSVIFCPCDVTDYPQSEGIFQIDVFLVKYMSILNRGNLNRNTYCSADGV